MDKKGLERCTSNLNWLSENGGKLTLKEWLTKMFDGTDPTTEDIIHFGKVIEKALIENKALNKKLT